MTDTDQLRERMVSTLLDAGKISPRWAEAMRSVPRHLFLPDTVYQHDQARPGNDLVPLRRADQPGEWLELAYADKAVITQVDDGQQEHDGIGMEASSSASQPVVVAEMLAALDVEPDMRVLEIGTGTGWNAALLAHRVGAGNVVTVEVDPVLAWQARTALDSAGFGKVTVVTGDGSLGYPDAAPYDRLIATVGTHSVPYLWVGQAGPDGRLVVPLSNTYQPPGIAVLTRHADATATGKLAGPAAFMELRAQRAPRFRGSEFIGDPDTTSSTDLHPYRWAGNRDAAVAIGQRVQDVHKVYRPATRTGGTLWLLDSHSRSWATVTLVDEPPYPVEQGGPRRLFDEVSDAYRWWREAGEPAVTDWTVTVGPDGQRIALPH